MNKKYNNKLIIGLAVPICLSISSVNLNNTKLQLDSNIVHAQDEQSNGFKIYEPEIGASGSLEFLSKVKIHQILYLIDIGKKLIKY